jgi:hypothetical protein
MSERICSVDDCEKTAEKRGWCGMHYRRWQRWGDLNVVHPRVPEGPRPWLQVDRPGYIAAHVRVYRARGRAREHTCPCGAQAAQWAYDHSDLEPLTEMRRNMKGDFVSLAYSPDPSRYVAMCRSCHVKLDKSNKHPTIRLVPLRYV